MNTKTCSVCHKNKSISQFYKKLDGFSGRCLICEQKYQQAYYKRNRKARIAAARINGIKQRIKIEEYLISYLNEHPCIECNERDILVLQFDHREPTEKLDTVSRMTSATTRPVSLKRLVTEIEKCDVRCANCHQRKTAKSTKYWKLKYL